MYAFEKKACIMVSDESTCGLREVAPYDRIEDREWPRVYHRGPQMASRLSQTARERRSENVANDGDLLLCGNNYVMRDRCSQVREGVGINTT